MEAKYYSRKPDGSVLCSLCPQNCTISNDKTGICGTRKNINGMLVCLTYGEISGLNFDPIEKKPLYHFYPGKKILSVGSSGCNLSCRFCQNWSISQKKTHETSNVLPSEIVKQASTLGNNIGIAFTYNEPTVWFEFMLDIAKEAKQAGLKTVVVSNGYISPEPLSELADCIDAFNIDLKAFSNEFYIKQTKSTLQPVLDNLKYIVEKQKHLEVTNLLIRNLNDDIGDFSEMINWYTLNLGVDVPLHISRYFPNYKCDEAATSVDSLVNAYEIANAKLNYVYLGNVNYSFGSDTFCRFCNAKLISRNGYDTVLEGINEKGDCEKCGKNNIICI